MAECPKCGCEVLMPVEYIIVPEGLQKIVQCFECDYIFLDGILKRYWDRKHVLHRLQTRRWRAKIRAGENSEFVTSLLERQRQ